MQLVQNMQNYQNLQNRAYQSNLTIPNLTSKTCQTKHIKPNHTKPNLANQTYQAKSTKWPTNRDLFLIISSIVTIGFIMWGERGYMSSGKVSRFLKLLIESVNAWVRGAFYIIFQIGVVVTLIVLCCLSRRNKKRQQGFVIIFSCPSSSLPT